MSKVCTKCGCINESDNARFCNDCGERFEDEPATFNKPKKITLTPVTEPKAPSVREEPSVASEEPVKNYKEPVKPQYSEPVSPVVSDKVEEDDDEDDYSTPIVVQNTIPEEINDDFFDEDLDNPKPFVDPESKFIEQPEEKTEEEVTNDKYYDDILPVIDNEIKAIPKDIIFKGIGIVMVLIAVAFYMISVW